MGMVRMILLPQQSACALRDGLRGIIVPVEAFSDKRNEKRTSSAAARVRAHAADHGIEVSSLYQIRIQHLDDGVNGSQNHFIHLIASDLFHLSPYIIA